MHDPLTVAFEIKNPFVRKRGGYRPSLITIWHKDPEKDGTDDSCGWFIRLRHADKVVYEKIVREFEFEWDRTWSDSEEGSGHGYVYNCGWFKPDGSTNLSVQGIVFNMYLFAAKIALSKNDNKPRKDWNIAWRFMQKHLVEIIYFAENNRDSISDSITRKFQIGTNTPYTPKKRMEMIRDCANTIYTDILRKTRPWYRHPRWHIHHWRIQISFWQRLKRRYWERCDNCHKRFKGQSVYSDWNGTRKWCGECEGVNSKPLAVDQKLAQ